MIGKLTFLIVNVLVSIVLGSRMVLVASIFTSICTFILISNKKSIKFYITTFLIGGGLSVGEPYISVKI
ncbi:hypothetical protein ACA29_22955 [Lederbergia galactosidilytica]|uniref:Uncharacterized protein n=1 Tax=Lederbergia galactosidilytica TaxID=217031 RepID=A0A0Q9XXV3_9BACI|nr:hypothetical protein ACA29_22955 [Lederbergia galactosidilytica]